MSHFDKSDFYKLTDIFCETIVDIKKYPQDIKEIDMSKIYYPNWACSWNKISNINKPCVVVERNEYLTLVLFINQKNQELINNLYRIEDLQEFEIGNMEEQFGISANIIKLHNK